MSLFQKKSTLYHSKYNICSINSDPNYCCCIGSMYNDFDITQDMQDIEFYVWFNTCFRLTSEFSWSELYSVVRTGPREALVVMSVFMMLWRWWSRADCCDTVGSTNALIIRPSKYCEAWQLWYKLRYWVAKPGSNWPIHSTSSNDANPAVF